MSRVRSSAGRSSGFRSRTSRRRRELQLAYNREHGITPESVRKRIDDVLSSVYEMDYVTVSLAAEEEARYRTPDEVEREIGRLRKRMLEAAASLEFEEAGRLRDEIRTLQDLEMKLFPDSPGAAR